MVLFTGHAPEVPQDIAALVRKPAEPEELLRVVYELLPRPGEAEG